MTKKTIYSVFDVETCIPRKEDKDKGMVFDLAWRNIDKKGYIYSQGSYLAVDVLCKYKPWYYEKMPKYWEYSKQGLIIPKMFVEIKDIYNKSINDLQDKGHKVLFCSYNGSFDTSRLKFTCTKLGLGKFLFRAMQFFCIWEYWSLSCPKNYIAPFTASKKYYSTSAENVYKFEFNEPDFIEEHIAFKDVMIEDKILLKVLARKKKIPVASTIKDLIKFVPDISKARVSPCVV